MKTLPCFDPAKTLFVSDLDGTLLGKDAAFPPSLDLPRRINSLTDSGINFTYATARTIQTTRHILNGIRFTAPVALMNGVLIRDMNRGEYLNAAYPDAASAVSILAKIEDRGLSAFLYTLTNGELATAFTDALNPFMRAFMEERISRYGKPFTHLDRLSDGITDDKSLIYIVLMDTRETLLPIYEAVTADPALKCAFYKDSYAPEIYYLEIFSAQASKGAAVKQLREITEAQTLVVFGDNTNDLPMFEESDFCCAVENAAEEVKAKANLVIGSAESGGVVEFLEKNQ